MEKTNFIHISLYKTPDESPGYLLWRVSTQWRGAIEQVLKPLNLTHPQFVVLATLAWLTKDGNKVSQIEIGRLAALDPNTTSQILRGLETKKFVTRKHSIDERSKNPVITKLGSEILAKAVPAVEQADVHFFSKITDNQVDSIVLLFQKLMASRS